MIGEPSFFDPKYDGLSPEEHIRQHDRDKMLWSQQQELARANELQQQQLQLTQEKLQAERENAEIKAKAIKQAEQDRFKNQLQLELLRQSRENTQRKLRLCDDLGVDYDEIQLFINYLSNADDSLNEKSYKISNNIEYKEKALNDYRKNKPDKSNIVKEYDRKIKSLESNVLCVENSYKNYSADVSVAYLLVLNLGLICGIIGCGIAWLSSNQALWGNWTIGLVIGMIAINISYRTLKNMKATTEKNNKLKSLKEDIEEAKREKDNALKKFSEEKENLMLKYNENVSRVTKEIEELKIEKENTENEIKRILCEKYNKFMEFRTAHYNEEMEMLLRKLDLTYLTSLDKEFIAINGDIDEHIEKEGTIKDYIQYMRKAVRN